MVCNFANGAICALQTLNPIEPDGVPDRICQMRAPSLEADTVVPTFALAEFDREGGLQTDGNTASQKQQMVKAVSRRAALDLL